MSQQPTTEQRNRQHLLDLFNLFDARNIDGALAKCADDIDYFVSAPIDLFPHLGHRRGKAEVRAMWQIIYGRYVECRHEVRAVIAEGDRVAVDLRAFLRKRANRRVLQFDMAVFASLQDGRLTRFRQIVDSYDLVQQVIERDLGAIIERPPA